jgi:hypothetical protein
MDSPQDVLDEGIVILDLISPDFDTAPVTSSVIKKNNMSARA